MTKQEAQHEVWAYGARKGVHMDKVQEAWDTATSLDYRTNTGEPLPWDTVADQAMEILDTQEQEWLTKWQGYGLSSGSLTQ